ncbi:hypothetical protein KM043_006117 [Ampulex compressa]|nr:hypothetical protein KM043_006117 [Ampulex compressa]
MQGEWRDKRRYGQGLLECQPIHSLSDAGRASKAAAGSAGHPAKRRGAGEEETSLVGSSHERRCRKSTRSQLRFCRFTNLARPWSQLPRDWSD